MRRNVAIGVVLVLLLALVAWWKLLRGGDDAPATIGGGGTSGSSAAIVTAKSTGTKPAATKVTLSGRVTRKADGSGVAGAYISISKKATIEGMFNRKRGTEQAPLATADAEGRWKLENVESGSYTLGATGAALLPASRAITVTASTDNIDFVLESGGTLVSGTVSDVLGGPIPGAKVQVRRNRDNPFTNDADIVAFTDDNGRYQLALLPGEFVFVATHEAYTPGTRFVEMTTEAIDVDFTLTPGATVRGQVVTTDGTPVADVSVAASPQGGPSINVASFAGGDVTDDKGEFTLNSLSPGALALTASGGGYSTASPTIVEVGIGEQIEGVRVVVERGFSISGRVVEKGTTKGIPGVRVGVFSIAASQAGMGRNPSGEDGSFVIEGLRPAPYTVFAIGDEVMPEVGKSVEIVDKDVNDVLVEMASGVTITGFVQPGTVASVSISPTMIGLANMFEAAKSIMVRAESDETGAFTLRHAPPGTFTIEAETADGRAGNAPLVIENVDKSGVIVKLEERASIAGRVIDTTGAGVGDVEVRASKREKDGAGFSFRMGGPGGGSNTARTRKDGSFLVVGLDEGTHELHVTDGRGRLAWATPPNKDKPNAPLEMELKAQEKKTNVTLTVETRDGSIKGVVVLPDGKPAPDTWITISKARPKKDESDKKADDIDYDEMRSWRGGIAPVITNAEGRFSIEKLRRGTYKVVGENAKGSARGQKDGVKTGETITLQLGRLGTLTGKVTVDGSPASPYDIDCDPVVREGWSSHEKRVTEKSGVYTLERLPPTEYSCTVTSDAGQATAKVTVPAGDVTLDIALVPWATVSGTVVSVLTGQPVEGVKLVAGAEGGKGFGDRQALTDLLGGKGPTSDARGAFSIRRVPPGSGSIMVMPATGGFRPLAQQKFEAKAGQNVDVGAIKIIPPRNGEAGTLGIGTDTEGDKLTVADVKEDGPGAAAGVQVGDRIVTINSIDVATLTPAIAQGLIGSGNMDVGQSFVLGIERAGSVQQVTVVAVKW